jgi:dipeptidyl aminopeptidase/acylaminoacyl peptidase
VIDRRSVERAAGLFPPEDGSFERLARRRLRKRRNQRLAAGALGLALFAALVIAGAIVHSGRTTPAHRPTPSPTIEESALPQLLRPGQFLWYRTPNDVGSGVFVVAPGPRPGGSVFGCDRTHRSPCPNVIDHGQAVLSGDGKWAAAATTTCNGSGLVCSTNGIWVANGLGDVIRVTRPCTDWLPDDCHGETWAWSPVGATLAVWEATDPQRLYLFDPASGQRTLLVEPAGAGVEGLTWSADGAQITYAVKGSTVAAAKIFTIPVTGGSPTFLARGLDPAWSPDGTELSYLVPGRGIVVMSADGSGAALVGKDGIEASWSPDGSRIVYRAQYGPKGGPYREEIWVTSADGSRPVDLFDATWVRIEKASLTWSPDGTEIAFEGNRHHPYWPLGYDDQWYVLEADGSGALRRIDQGEAAGWRTFP